MLINRRVFMDKHMGHEVPVDSLGDEWKGYVFRITGKHLCHAACSGQC